MVGAAPVGQLVGKTIRSAPRTVNTRADSENKYGTFFEFNPTGAKEIKEFDAVRYSVNTKDEKTVPFTLQTGTKAPTFADPEGHKFKLADAGGGYVTVALMVPDADGKKSRFDAEMRDEPRVGKVYSTENKLFKEKGGSRYLEGETPNQIFAPSSGTLFLAMALNVLMFVAWFIAFWPILQYLTGHALGLSLVFGVLTMVVLMPLLFKLNKPKPAAPGGGVMTYRIDGLGSSNSALRRYCFHEDGICGPGRSGS